MASPFSPQQIFRHVPAGLIRAYCESEKVPMAVAWDAVEDGDVEALFAGWLDVSVAARGKAEVAFRAVHGLATETGVKVLVEECAARGRPVGEAFFERDTHHAKAFACRIDDPESFDAAARFHQADELSASSWVRAAGLPREEPDTSRATLQALSRSLGTLFREREGRGQRVTVEADQRATGSHYLFCYPDDYAQAVPAHDRRGRLRRNSQVPTFSVVFVFDPAHGTLDLSAKGPKRLKEELQDLFCDVVLHAPGSAAAEAKPTYELDGLLSREFPLPVDPADGVEEVRVRSLCLAPAGGKRRITVAADPGRSVEDLYDAMDDHLKKFRPGRAHVVRATFSVRYTPRGRTPPGRFRSACPTRTRRRSGRRTTSSTTWGSGACGGGGSSVTDPARLLLTRADDEPAELDADDVGDWPAGRVDAYVAAGLLADTAPARSAGCDACGEPHVESVQWVDGAGDGRRAFLSCPEAGRVPVDAERLRRWVVSAAGLARWLAGSIGTAGGPEEVHRDRAWKLGRWRIGPQSRVLYFARGLGRADGAAVVESAREVSGPAAVVLVPDVVPPDAVWGRDRRPSVLSLRDVVSFGPAGPVFDRAAFVEFLTGVASGSAIPCTATFPTPAGAAWADVAFVVEDLHLRVRVGDVAERYGFVEAGFEDRRRKGFPNQTWELLKVLASGCGRLSPGEPTPKRKSASLKQRMSLLRSRLAELLQLDGDPFHPVGKGKGYQARFTVRRDGVPAVTWPAGTRWSQVSAVEDRPGEVRFWTGPRDRPGAQVKLALIDLDLGRPGRELLAEVLRSGGRVPPSTDAAWVLKLGVELTHLLGIDGVPFDFRPTTNTWVTEFTVEKTER